MAPILKIIVYIVILPILACLCIFGILIRILICPLPLCCIGTCLEKIANWFIGVPKDVYNSLIVEE